MRRGAGPTAEPASSWIRVTGQRELTGPPGSGASSGFRRLEVLLLVLAGSAVPELHPYLGRRRRALALVRESRDEALCPKRAEARLLDGSKL